MDREAVPKIVQARDQSSACRAMDPGDAPQGVECRLNGAAGEPRSVPVRKKEGGLALRKAAAPTQGTWASSTVASCGPTGTRRLL